MGERPLERRVPHNFHPLLFKKTLLPRKKEISRERERDTLILTEGRERGGGMEEGKRGEGLFFFSRSAEFQLKHQPRHRAEFFIRFGSRKRKRWSTSCEGGSLVRKERRKHVDEEERGSRTQKRFFYLFF